MHTTEHTASISPSVFVSRSRLKTSVPLDEPAAFAWLHKDDLEIDHEYQRSRIKHTVVNEIAKNFSWRNFGALMIARRPDGSLFVYDGQHRLLAAKKRSDVSKVPCLVFDMEDIKEEATSFKGINTNRSVVGAIDKFNAALVAGESMPVKIKDLLDRNSLVVSSDRSPGTIECISLVQRLADRNFDALEKVLPVVKEVNEGQVIHERLLDALFWIATQPGGERLFEAPIRAKMRLLGRAKLLSAAEAAASAYAKGGAKVWALGIIEAINKGMRKNKIDLLISTSS